MFESLAPGWWQGRLGTLPVAMSLAMFLMVGAWAPPAFSQEEPPPDAEVVPEEEEVRSEELEQKQQLTDTSFYDPVALETLENNFPTLFSNSPGFRNLQQILQMARGSGAVNPTIIDRFIESAAKDLTLRDNIQAIIDRDAVPDVRRVKEFEKAATDLIEPLLIPTDRMNPNFRRTYSAKLLQVLPDLLENHLFARTQAMIVLNRLQDPAALDLLVQTLSDEDQPIAVRLLAASGITQITRSGQQLGVNETVRAARALVDFLENNPDTFWLARVRALEALGALRQVADIQNRNEARMATAAFAVLVDPEERLETRAWAFWALGMLEVPSGFPQINYGLIAYQAGRLASRLGHEIIDAELPQAQYLTGLLVFQISQGLNGDPQDRSVGLVNSRQIGPHSEFVNQVNRLVRQVGANAVRLSNARGTQVPPARQALQKSLAELDSYLDRNRPQDRTLVPGGPSFEPATAQVAAER
ncbi:hypothetical protein BH23PLA1_BH23PLA1_23100 [soil metagenome]